MQIIFLLIRTRELCSFPHIVLKIELSSIHMANELLKEILIKM